MTELERIYDCVFCEGKRKNWNLKTEQYEPCSCIEKVASIEALIDKREREAEARGVLRLASRFRGKGNTRLTGTEMANRIMGTEANKLLKQLGVPQSRENIALSAKHSPEQGTDMIDRFEVIDETGRAYVKGSIYGSPVKIELSYQDDGRTLKVFVSDKHSSKEDI